MFSGYWRFDRSECAACKHYLEHIPFPWYREPLCRSRRVPKVFRSLVRSFLVSASDGSCLGETLRHQIFLSLPSRSNKENIKLAILFCWIYSGLCQTGVHLMGTRSTFSIILGSHVSIGCVFFVSSSYAVLYSETHRHQRMIKAQYLSQEVVEKFLKDSKALKTTVLVVVAVGLCYLPVSFYLVFGNYEKRLYLVREMTFSLVSFNSLLNPLIYCLRQREIRKLIFRPILTRGVSL